MVQQGQVFELTKRGHPGETLWAYRYRVGGRGSKRMQKGGFASEQDAREALERELERLRRDRRISRSLTLAELVETYLAQHDVQPVTIEKLRWLLGKALAVFGDRRIAELTSQEIAEWRMTLSAGYRFEATQALRQVLHRAVAWGMIDTNPARVGVDNPIRRRKEQAPVRIVGGAGGSVGCDRSALRTDDRVRSRDRTSTGGVGRAREARRRLRRPRRLRPPLLHAAGTQAAEDRGEPAGGAAPGPSARCARGTTGKRGTAAVPGRARRLSRHPPL